MKHCFIISENCEFLTETKKLVNKTDCYTPTVTVKLDNNAYVKRLAAFEYITEKFNKLAAQDLRESVVIVDEYFDNSKADVAEILGGDNHPEQLYAMLVLAYPELRFAFVNGVCGQQSITELLEGNCEPFAPIFDECGLRNAIRNTVNVRGKETLSIPMRDLSARVIEDEHAYAYFHGYIAYKRGYKTKLFTCLDHLEKEKKSVSGSINLQIQDISLSFVDKDSNIKLSSFDERHEKFPFLRKENSKAEIDCVITIGNGNFENIPAGAKKINKPTKGMYHIIKKLELNEFGYRSDRVNDGSNKHSAPGIVVFLAERMILRSQATLDSAKDVQTAIQSATIALDAKELLNGLTPTIAFQALILQHKAEVTAECLFAGTEYNIELGKRFGDIKRETTAISEIFSNAQQEKVSLNVQLSIVELLSGIYSSHRQFEEELQCLAEARKLHREIKIREGKDLKSHYHYVKLFYHGIVTGTFNFAFRGVVNFVKVILAIQITFGFIYFVLFRSVNYSSFRFSLDSDDIRQTAEDFILSLVAATKYFFTSETSNSFEMVFQMHEFLGDIILAFQGFLSLASVSTLMAMIFLRTSRR